MRALIFNSTPDLNVRYQTKSTNTYSGPARIRHKQLEENHKQFLKTMVVCLLQALGVDSQSLTEEVKKQLLERLGLQSDLLNLLEYRQGALKITWEKYQKSLQDFVGQAKNMAEIE